MRLSPPTGMSARTSRRVGAEAQIDAAAEADDADEEGPAGEVDQQFAPELRADDADRDERQGVDEMHLARGVEDRADDRHELALEPVSDGGRDDERQQHVRCACNEP